MTKQFLIAAALIVLMNSAGARGGQEPSVAPKAAALAKHQHVKTAIDRHGTAMASQVHGPAMGRPGKRDDIDRTVTIDMTDAMRFTPASVKVKRGETVRFVVKNSGKLKHEMVLGSMRNLKKHADMMRKLPEMEHAEDNMVFVEPGKSGELIWTFNAPGEVDFACLQPGHFEAGMKGKVAVK